MRGEVPRGERASRGGSVLRECKCRGRGGRNRIRINDLLLHSRQRPRRGAGPDPGLRGGPPGRHSGEARTLAAERPGAPGGVRTVRALRNGSYYFLARRFRFTYAPIFFVISEWPMGLEPMADPSVSAQPLKLIA